MNNSASYADQDIIDNLGKSSYNHTGTISGTSSLTINSVDNLNSSAYRQKLNGTYTFTGSLTVNSGQLLVYKDLQTKDINLTGGDMYVLKTDALQHDAVVNVRTGSMLAVESYGNAIQDAEVNVFSGGSFSINRQDLNTPSTPIKINIAGAGRPSDDNGVKTNCLGAIQVLAPANKNLNFTANINLTDDAKIYLKDITDGYQLYIRGKLTGSSTLTLASSNADWWIRFYEGDSGLNMSDFAGNFVVDNVKVRFYTNSLGSGSNITVQNSGTAYFNNTAALNSYTGSFTVNDATISLLANGKLNNLSGNADGIVTIGANALTLNNTADTEFSGVISGSGSLTKIGAKSQTLSGDNTYDGGTTISDGTLKLSGAGTLGTGAVTNSGTLEFNNSTATITPNISGAGDILVSAGTATLSGAVTQTGGATTLANGTTLNIGNASTLYNLSVPDDDSSAMLNITGNLTLNNSDLTKFIGSITAPVVTKTGLDTLQLCFDAQNAVSIGSLVVSSGRVDLKGYMQGGITVDANGVFSPGNSVGEAKFGGGYELYDGAKLLIEMDETGVDSLIASSFIENGGIIELVIDGIPSGAQYDVITATNGFSSSQDEAYWLGKFGTLPDYMTLSVVDGVYGANSQTVRLSLEHSAAVPEPSTWALLLLGAAGLLYIRKRTGK